MKPGENTMKLFDMIKAFHNNESGAVTVDWVVLTAAIVGLGLAVVASVRSGTSTLAGAIETSLTSATVAQLN
jgi:Flp pilus assembly pilin Flp